MNPNFGQGIVPNALSNDWRAAVPDEKRSQALQQIMATLDKNMPGQYLTKAKQYAIEAEERCFNEAQSMEAYRTGLAGFLSNIVKTPEILANFLPKQRNAPMQNVQQPLNVAHLAQQQQHAQTQQNSQILQSIAVKLIQQNHAIFNENLAFGVFMAKMKAANLNSRFSDGELQEIYNNVIHLSKLIKAQRQQQQAQTQAMAQAGGQISAQKGIAPQGSGAATNPALSQTPVYSSQETPRPQNNYQQQQTPIQAQQQQLAPPQQQQQQQQQQPRPAQNNPQQGVPEQPDQLVIKMKIVEQIFTPYHEALIALPINSGGISQIKFLDILNYWKKGMLTDQQQARENTEKIWNIALNQLNLNDCFQVVMQKQINEQLILTLGRLIQQRYQQYRQKQQQQQQQQQQTQTQAQAQAQQISRGPGVSMQPTPGYSVSSASQSAYRATASPQVSSAPRPVTAASTPKTSVSNTGPNVKKLASSNANPPASSTIAKPSPPTPATSIITAPTASAAVVTSTPVPAKTPTPTSTRMSASQTPVPAASLVATPTSVAQAAPSLGGTTENSMLKLLQAASRKVVSHAVTAKPPTKKPKKASQSPQAQNKSQKESSQETSATPTPSTSNAESGTAASNKSGRSSAEPSPATTTTQPSTTQSSLNAAREIVRNTTLRLANQYKSTLIQPPQEDKAIIKQICIRAHLKLEEITKLLPILFLTNNESQHPETVIRVGLKVNDQHSRLEKDEYVISKTDIVAAYKFLDDAFNQLTAKCKALFQKIPGASQQAAANTSKGTDVSTSSSTPADSINPPKPATNDPSLETFSKAVKHQLDPSNLKLPPGKRRAVADGGASNGSQGGEKSNQTAASQTAPLRAGTAATQLPAGMTLEEFKKLPKNIQAQIYQNEQQRLLQQKKTQIALKQQQQQQQQKAVAGASVNLDHEMQELDKNKNEDPISYLTGVLNRVGAQADKMGTDICAVFEHTFGSITSPIFDDGGWGGQQYLGANSFM
ncbi:hypothetical protein H4219_002797 [Mycoemilia scoparia]|uniref:Mediator complex subunit 15 KIX domain-containing protein n=1 Tax=Mycoemilia scoparia TaxID=417184 RepID=A0A9W8DTL3_9FUNG|nr:hypothetical protein H4219_002797 [Mycoemilia scoparia]